MKKHNILLVLTIVFCISIQNGICQNWNRNQSGPNSIECVIGNAKINISDNGSKVEVTPVGFQITFDKDGKKVSAPFNFDDDNYLEYYDNFAPDIKKGKLKRIGSVELDYYDGFSNEQKVGKISRIGDLNIDYWDSFSNDAKKGKLKSVGNLQIDYYDTFSSDEKVGKIMHIGDVSIDYYRNKMILK